jgi:hypothetical protein
MSYCQSMLPLCCSQHSSYFYTIYQAGKNKDCICVISFELFLASITLIVISLINLPALSLCAWIHFQHHHGHMTKTPEQNNIHVHLSNDVLFIVSSVINLI